MKFILCYPFLRIYILPLINIFLISTLNIFEFIYLVFQNCSYVITFFICNFLSHNKNQVFLINKNVNEKYTMLPQVSIICFSYANVYLMLD